MAILGMLTIGPMSGYDMKQFCERSLAHFWHESYGNLYPRLKRLAGAGLIRGRRERRKRAPDATIYSLTASGRLAFLAWLVESPEPERVRSEFLLKIFFAKAGDPTLVQRRLLEHELEQLRALENYAAIERLIGEDDPAKFYWRLALRRGQLLTEARLRWCRESLVIVQNAQSGEGST